MDKLISQVREYRNARDTAEKMEVAGKIILRISDSITLFLISRASLQVADLRQTIFVAIVRGLDGFRGDSDVEFWAWCYQIARNTVGKHFAKKQSDILVSVEPEELARLIEASGAKESMQSEEKAMVDEALALLKGAKPECFSLLWNHFIIGSDIKEIAAELGLAYDAVRMKITRCLSFTRSLVE